MDNKNGTKYIQSETAIAYNENGVAVKAHGAAQDVTTVIIAELENTKILKELSNRYNDLQQFSYIVSHNLRAPIANILGLAALLNESNEEEKIKVVKYIYDSVLKIDDLIKDLNAVLTTRSNVEANKENIKIVNLLNNIFGTFYNQIDNSDAIISIKIEENAKEIITVKSYLESILYNLISNSIKYKSSSRKLKIDISGKIIKDKYIFTISDNGIGIDLDLNRKYLFGLYKRFNFEKEGKGLGLHMVKTQVDAIGGEITVESELNEGTAFSIILPVN